MAFPKYQDYLAANVLNEGSVVNYRMLSRALKVHVNTAKEMLYDFHHTQNARKSSSVHATYLLTGTRKSAPCPSQVNGNHTQDGDSFMSDGLASSSMPMQEEEEVEQIPVTSVTLVAQEHLEAVKALYERVTSIHLYSIGPGPLTNIYILSDCNRKAASDTAQEDPLETWKQYGTIHNPHTKRRTNKRPPAPTAATTAPVTAGMKPTTKPAAAASADKAAPPETKQAPVKQSTESPAPAPAPKAEAPATKPDTKKPATLKKESSNLFKSFAKTKQPTTAAAKSASSSDVSAPMSENEDEGSAAEEPSPAVESAEDKTKAEAARAKRKEEEEKLAAMMDASDDEDEDADALPGIESDAPAKDQEGDVTMTEAEAVAEKTGALDAPAAPADEAEPTTTTTNGRRRGRRRVMKKKTTRDAEGYLVTKEEPVWEEFSEDEVAPPPAKRAAVAVPAAAKKVAQGGGGKKGQGNIMSFFGKK